MSIHLNFDIHRYRIERVVPSTPWHPRFSFADPTRFFSAYVSDSCVYLVSDIKKVSIENENRI